VALADQSRSLARAGVIAGARPVLGAKALRRRILDPQVPRMAEDHVERALHSLCHDPGGLRGALDVCRLTDHVYEVNADRRSGAKFGDVGVWPAKFTS